MRLANLFNGIARDLWSFRGIKMKKTYDFSWDMVISGRGNLPKSEDALDKKYQEWKNRSGFPLKFIVSETSA